MLRQWPPRWPRRMVRIELPDILLHTATSTSWTAGLFSRSFSFSSDEAREVVFRSSWTSDIVQSTGYKKLKGIACEQALKHRGQVEGEEGEELEMT